MELVVVDGRPHDAGEQAVGDARLDAKVKVWAVGAPQQALVGSAGEFIDEDGAVLGSGSHCDGDGGDGGGEKWTEDRHCVVGIGGVLEQKDDSVDRAV